MSAPLFPVGSTVRHIKTGGLYTITEGPNSMRIESGAVPAYAYRMTDGGVMTWVRPQSEMEDGRFVIIPNEST